MCGIAGQVVFGAEAHEPDVRRMLQCIVHRGPDEEGLGYYGPACLGIRRLSIIDVEGGSQPIANEDGTVFVVQNGEIYNYVELRRELERLGHRFRTASDTEVIVHAYEEHGDRFLDHLNGMFAIALWDSCKRKLVLARDRLGKKPLYWCCSGQRLWFASELKCLMAAGAPVGEVNWETLYHYLVLGYIPHPLTAFAGVSTLSPGWKLEYQGGHVRQGPYWELRPRVRPWDEQEAAGQLRSLLEDAVRIRLRSDVPLGGFLSGGLDSSIVVALAARLSSRRLRTFHIRFADDPHPEAHLAAAVARRYGTEHHELTVTPERMDMVERVLELYDEPFGDASAVPTWYVSGLTRQYVTVALAGDGGDENFGGYTRYRTALQYDAVRRRYGWLCAAASPLVRNLTPSFFPGRNMIQAIGMERLRAFACGMVERQVRELLGPEFLRHVGGTSTWDLVRQDILAGDSCDPLSPLTTYDARRYLPDDILVKVDRASMGHALEVRAPMLDYRVVELAASMPASLKLDAQGGKRILRLAFGDLLPPEVLQPRKRGFSAPLGKWLAGELRALLFDHLLDGPLTRHGLLRRDRLAVVVREHLRGRRDHRSMLWRLLVLGRWVERQVLGRSSCNRAFLFGTGTARIFSHA